MISEARREASRRNGRRGQGPRTAEGKARSSRNAVRHGLSQPAGLDPEFADQIAAMARAIAGAEAGRERFEMACRIACAQMDVARVRRARADLLSVQPLDGATLARAVALDRYEARALAGANAPSGYLMPHLRSQRSEPSEIVPRPQRFRRWLCGEVVLTLWAARCSFNRRHSSHGALPSYFQPASLSHALRSATCVFSHCVIDWVSSLLILLFNARAVFLDNRNIHLGILVVFQALSNPLDVHLSRRAHFRSGQTRQSSKWQLRGASNTPCWNSETFERVSLQDQFLLINR